MNNKIKIAYVISTLENCGPVNILFNLVKYLNRNVYDPIIITLSPENTKTRVLDFERLGIKVIQLNLSRIEGMFFAQKKIVEIVGQENIQILHGHSFRADGIIAKMKGILTTNTLHNYPFYDFPMTYGKFQGKWMAKKHLQLIKKISFPVACSKSVANLFKEHQDLSLSYVQNGVDIEIFQASKHSKGEWKRKLGLDPNKVLFLVVGVLTSRKDPFTIIEAFKNRREQLLFLGEGELLEEARKRNNNPNVKFLGRVSNVADYLKATDYYISAALVEGLPNTVLEALATGVPTILSDIGPHREILEYDKTLNQYLFKVGDSSCLLQKIEEMFLSDYKELSQKSEAIIDNYLSAEVMAKGYEVVYQSLIKGV